MSDVRDDDGLEQTGGPAEPAPVPDTEGAAPGQPEQEPQREGDRQAADTLRGISRLEEAN